jgi:hypothetical protein
MDLGSMGPRDDGTDGAAWAGPARSHVDNMTTLGLVRDKRGMT